MFIESSAQDGRRLGQAGRGAGIDMQTIQFNSIRITINRFIIIGSGSYRFRFITVRFMLVLGHIWDTIFSYVRARPGMGVGVWRPEEEDTSGAARPCAARSFDSCASARNPSHYAASFHSAKAVVHRADLCCRGRQKFEKLRADARTARFRPCRPRGWHSGSAAKGRRASGEDRPRRAM